MNPQLVFAAVAYLITLILWAIWLIISSVAWPVWMSPIYAISLIAYPISVFYILILAFKRHREGLTVDSRYYFWPLLFALAALVLSFFHFAKRAI